MEKMWSQQICYCVLSMQHHQRIVLKVVVKTVLSCSNCNLWIFADADFWHANHQQNRRGDSTAASHMAMLSAIGTLLEGLLTNCMLYNMYADCWVYESYRDQLSLP